MVVLTDHGMTANVAVDSGKGESMDSEMRRLDSARKVALELEMSGLRDEVEVLGRRIRSTLGGGLVLTVLFVVGGTFMDKSSTLWFLGVMWLVLASRLVIMNRTSGREMRLKEAALESLANPAQDTTLPHGP